MTANSSKIIVIIAVFVLVQSSFTAIPNSGGILGNIFAASYRHQVTRTSFERGLHNFQDIGKFRWAIQCSTATAGIAAIGAGSVVLAEIC